MHLGRARHGPAAMGVLHGDRVVVPVVHDGSETDRKRVVGELRAAGRSDLLIQRRGQAVVIA